MGTEPVETLAQFGEGRPARVEVGSDDNKTRYRVEYRTMQDVVAGNPEREATRVTLYAGYSDLGDIPKIVAIAAGLRVEDVVIVSIELVGITVDGIAR